MGKVVYSYYVLDLLHKGHIRYMEKAKQIAGENGISIVGILTDKAVMERKEKPVLSFEDRMKIANAIRYNDIVVPQDTYSPIPNATIIRPDILIESPSHKPEDIDNYKTIVKMWGGKVVIVDYTKEISSSIIKERIKNADR